MIKTERKRKFYAATIGVSLFISVGCQRGEPVNTGIENNTKTPTNQSATVEPAETYRKNGISFVLRKGWKVTEDEEMGGGIRYLNVENDQNATVALNFTPRGMDPDLKEYAADFMSNLKSGLAGGMFTENGEVEVRRNAAGIEKKGLARKYTATLAGETVPHTAEIFLVNSFEYDCVVIYNAPDDEKNGADAGFETILYTIKARNEK